MPRRAKASIELLMVLAHEIETVEGNRMGLIGTLMAEEGAVLNWRNGTNEFRMHGIAGTATDTPENALRSWARVARRQIEKRQAEARAARRRAS